MMSLLPSLSPSSVMNLSVAHHDFIYQVGYPTLTAFAEFVSQFDMPSGGNLKKKETSLLEIGTPFRPAMFEAVLKNFTPEIASSTSGRPRFVNVTA